MHIPLTVETYHYANHNFFNSFQQPPYFITTCRGKVTDTTALIYALENKKIKAAGLDVLENERLSSYTESEKKQLERLLSAGNVLITPHIAGWTKEARERIFMKVLEKFKSVIIKVPKENS